MADQKISQLTELTTPANGDYFPIVDISEIDANKNKRITYANLGGTKVAIDASAVSGYIGAAYNDGVLRTDTTLDYTDGGNFVTLGLDSTLKSNYDSAYSHISTNGSSHTYIDQDVTSGSSPTFDGANLTGIDAVNVDIADAGGIITATEVEGALQENRTAIDLNTTHRGLTNNPHSTSIANIGSGTLAELNAALTDATLQTESVETITVMKTGGDHDNIADAVTAANASGVDCIIKVGAGTFPVTDTMAFTNAKFL